MFSPIAEHPVRGEFFGDEIEQLRYFPVADQRSLPEALPSVQFPASREVLLSEDVRQRAGDAARVSEHRADARTNRGEHSR